MEATLLQTVPQPIIRFLSSVTGLDVIGFLFQDVVAVVITVPLLLYAAIRNKPETNQKIGIVLSVIGALLFSWKYASTGTFQILSEGALNIAAATTIGILLTRSGFVRNETMTLFVGVAVMFTTYPLAIVFPIGGSVLPRGFELFTFTVIFYSAIVLLPPIVFQTLRSDVKHIPVWLRGISQKVGTDEVLKMDTKILREEDNYNLLLGISTSDLKKYLDWKGHDSLSDVDSVDFEEFLNKQGREAPSESVINEYESYLTSLSDEENVLIYNPPSPARILFVSVTLSIIFGDIILTAFL